MSQRFVKGYTNNHLSWVMVDATDFATPESALSAATTIKIYGKVKGGTGVNFVSSGTGSLTNDIQHAGASALGLYTIALVKADLSDASAAWYDQYIISLSATGAAYQALIIDGGIMESYLSAALSDALSGVVALSDAVSNVHSELTSQFAVVSNYLSSISAIASDAHSAAILGASNASEAQSHATLAASRILLVQSRLSDYMSAIYPSDISDIRSMLAGISDILSQVVGDTVYISGIVSGLGAGQTASAIADKVWSDFGSKTGATPSQMYSVILIGTSAASDAASAAQQANSRVILVQSRLSDYMSAIYPSDISDIRSMLAGISDILSQVVGDTVYISGIVSGLGAGQTASAIADKVWSDYGSKVGATPSQVYSALLRGASMASDAASGVTVLQSRITSVAATSSDLVSKIWSDFTSKMGATPSQLYSVALVGASAASDAASAAQAANSRILLVQSRLSDFTSAVYPSDISDIRSMLTALSDAVSNAYSAAVVGASRALLVQSNLSELNSAYTSDISDIRSMLTAMSGMLSDAHSAAILAASNASEAHSAAVLGLSMLSDIDSALTSQYSDLKSGIGAVSVALSASDISDLASQVVVAISSAIIDVNVVQVNEVPVSGTGAPGDTWGPT